MINIIIVEDEVLIAEHLKACLEDEGYNVLGNAISFQEAIGAIAVCKPDLVLLDINLEGDLDGIDLANELRTKYQIPFIFITSNTDTKTIARAKITNPMGFLVKPFQPQDLKPAIELGLWRANNRVEIPKEAQAESTKEETHFFMKQGIEWVKIAYDEITHAKACDNYTEIFYGDKKHLLSQTLKQVEGKLSGKQFVRVHRSYLVNIKHIDCIRHSSVLINEVEIPFSPKMKDELMSKFNLF